MPETSTLRFNPYVEAVQPSATLAMTARAKALKREGRPVIGLSAGEPDFATPAPIAAAGVRAIHEGHTHYTENPGTPRLREAICRKLAQDNGLHYTVEQIVCSNGAKQSVTQTVFALTRPGDEVLIPAPYWVSYPEMVHMAGGTPVALPTSAATEYKITPEQLEAALNEKTRLLIFNSPSNPTGAVYSRDEMEALAAVLRRFPDVWVLSDEIYEKIVFDAEHVAFASLPGMLERTITVNGFSKAYAMTGWRLGYLAAPLPIAKAVGKVQSQFTSGPSSISQQAGVAALEMEPGPIEEMVVSFRKRRDAVLSALRAIDGIVCPQPEGAFYLFPDVSAFFGTTAPSGRAIANSDDLSFYLLEEHDVALVSGAAFGTPEGLRISYAAAMEDLEEAMRRVTRGLAALT